MKKNNDYNFNCLIKRLVSKIIILELNELRLKVSCIKLASKTLNILKTTKNIQLLKIIKLWRFYASYTKISKLKAQEKIIIDDLQFIDVGNSIKEEVDMISLNKSSNNSNLVSLNIRRLNNSSLLEKGFKLFNKK